MSSITNLITLFQPSVIGILIYHSQSCCTWLFLHKWMSHCLDIIRPLSIGQHHSHQLYQSSTFLVTMSLSSTPDLIVLIAVVMLTTLSLTMVVYHSPNPMPISIYLASNLPLLMYFLVEVPYCLDYSTWHQLRFDSLPCCYSHLSFHIIPLERLCWVYYC